ncbi:3-deoxy-D-manno-octulosonic acid transferase [Oligoflexus tunisiensis]|uniref:3-deoxy-D-manno-octulosonic acid transferase n=1 Tax=Oligoflexus tunisiensis TaxID=708132 RepID=UPI00159F086C|nr:glycosyltransferase N-terminal domain-containing protein [Oligoflexus tunisiensis]
MAQTEFFSNLALGVYELFWQFLIRVLVPLLKLIPALRPQLEGRQLTDAGLQKIAAERQRFPQAMVFFCSSAGEYEQAKPLMDRLQKQGDTFVFLILVSYSGKRFALAQNESVPFIMAPWDAPRAWQRLFAVLRPEAFVVVRYELWPGFLLKARAHAPVYLIDAVRSPGLVKKSLARSLRRALVRLCRQVFTVGLEDQAFYADLLQRPTPCIPQVGDTKYDRVLERLEQREDKRRQLREQLAAFLSSGPLLILGSAWPQDLDTLLDVYPALQAHFPQLKLIVAPHDISATMAGKMQASLESRQLRVCRAQAAGLAAAGAGDNVLLVDMIGLLPELYALADIAWVGGALHHRVHNVLEPACQGLFVCFGPRYHTSQEARQLVAEGLVKVIHSGQEFLEWVQGLHWEGHPPHKRLYEAIIRHRGATERILQAIQADTRNVRR